MMQGTNGGFTIETTLNPTAVPPEEDFFVATNHGGLNMATGTLLEEEVLTATSGPDIF